MTEDTRHLIDPPVPTETSLRVIHLLDLLAGRQPWLMAEYLQVNKATISRVIACKRLPSRSILGGLALHPRVNRSWLYTGLGEPLVGPPGASVGKLAPLSHQSVEITLRVELVIQDGRALIVSAQIPQFAGEGVELATLPLDGVITK